MPAPLASGPTALIVENANAPMQRSRLFAGFSLAYLMLTLASMAWYVVILGPYTTNDLFWPAYNRTGFAVFLVDVINVKLSRVHDAPVDMFAVEALPSKDYASHVVQSTFESSYTRSVFYTELNTLPQCIQDLRSLSNPWDISVHYCWVDFDRRWEVAHTAARAKRCLARYTDNAANYLETPARNTNWTALFANSRNAWMTTIGWALLKSPEGVAWMNDRPQMAMALSVDDEVRYLESRNLTRFELVYHNGFKLSLTETIEVENAFRQRQTLTIKTTSFARAPWTTIHMYWNFKNDINIFHGFNASLVRGDSRHFEALGWEMAMFYSLNDFNTRDLTPHGLFYSQISPFGSVDVLYVSLPPALLVLGSRFETLLRERLWVDPTLASQMLAMPDVTLFPRPPKFRMDDSLMYYGGNLLCTNNPPTTVPQTQFAFDDACAQPQPLKLLSTGQALLFAVTVSRAQSVHAICTEKATPTDGCLSSLSPVVVLAKALELPASDMAGLVASAVAALPPVQFYQYAKNSSGDWLLLQQPLLTPDDPNWSFLGWVAIFDWMQGKREVVRLEGDVSTVYMMSEVNPTALLPLTSQTQGDQSGPRTMYVLVLYTTALSIALGGLIASCAVWTRLRFNGRNLLMFNRVATFVWIGRPLLVLRGLTAILIASSSTTAVVRSVGIVQFVESRRSLLEALVVTGETAWVGFVACDVLVMFTGSTAKSSAPLVCALAWVVALAVELRWPVSLTASLERRCIGISIDHGMDCTAGIVHTGDFDRILVLLAIQALAVLISTVGVLLWHRKIASNGRAPLLLHGAAEAFLQPSLSNDADTWLVDDISCVMTGLLPFSFRGKHYTFDVKLWVLIQDHRDCCRHGGAMLLRRPILSTKTMHNVFGATAASPPITPVTAGALLHKLTVFGGFLYVIFTGLGSVSYIAVSTVNFANDFYWASFNMTGHHVVIADWLNRQFMLRNASLSFRLDEPRWTALQRNYSNLKIATSTPTGVGLLVQQARITDLEMAIAGLRRSNPCLVPWISTQYCWVDFDRKWPMANSRARQQRCFADVSNGAVYLEAALRNVGWSAFDQCWGTSFDTAIANELKASGDGRAWLAMVQQPPLDLGQEVAVWERAGVNKYVAQWQTYKSHGFINTYMVENAFGVQYPMTLTQSNGSLTLASQTSFKMYWGLASDLWAVGSNTTLLGGKSLISSSANYAFANQSMLAVLLHNGTLLAPLVEAYIVVQRDIGPFGSIDMKLIACPDAVRDAVTTGLQLVRRTLSTSPTNPSRAYRNFTLETLGVMPTAFKTISFLATFGGTIMCPQTGAYDLAMFTKLTKRDAGCGAAVAAALYPSADMLLIAAMASGLGLANASQIDRVCWHDRYYDRCRTMYMAQTTRFIGQFISPTDIQDIERLGVPAGNQVRQLNVTLMQYIRQSRTGPLEMGRAALFDASDPTYDMWSWLYAIEWAMGNREVVSFQGDAGSINILTDAATAFSQAIQTAEMPTTFATYARSGVQYVTGVMLGIAVFIGLCILTSRGRIEGLNMFELNRVGGMVWVGRPLLLLRGLTALCLLSTATLELVPLGYYLSTFHVPTLPWYKTFLSAGEVTWLVYILNDIMTIWTKEYTQYYAPISCALVWLASAALTIASPVVHRATLDPHCQVDEMDLQLTCQSGVVAIGDSNRLAWLLGIIAISNVVAYVFARLAYSSNLPPKPPRSLLLSSGAKYLFEKRGWMYGDVYYMDAASALLNGLLSFRWGQTSYVVDIKLWRTFMFDMDDDLPPRLAYAVPLAD